MGLKNGRQLSSLLVGFATVAAFTGCGNFSQDPLAGKLNPGDELRKPGNEQQKPRERVPSDALVIDAPDYITYKEEVDGGPKPISGRVLIPVNSSRNPKVGRDFDIQIVNLKDFKGATYDQIKGQFIWTPPKATVGDLSREMDLNVVLTTRSQPVYQRDKTIKVYITRGESVPEVVSVDGLSNTRVIKEGDQRNFFVVVKDPDGTDPDPAKIIIAPSKQGTPSPIGQAISMSPNDRWSPNPVRDPQDPTLWKYKMLLDLNGKEVTNGKTDFSFDTLAISRFGKVSAPKTTTITVVTNVSQPLCSLAGVVEIPAGVQSVVNFTIQDPKGEGRVTASFNRCAGQGAQCKCVPFGWKTSVQNCTMTWTPPQVPFPTDYEIFATATNTNPIDQSVVQGTCSAQVRVVRSVVREPAVTPEPEAEPAAKETREKSKKRSRS